MVVQLDDAKIKVTFDIDDPTSPTTPDGRLDDRERKERQKKEVREVVKKEVTQHKSFRLTKSERFKRNEERLGKVLQLVEGGVSGISLTEKYLAPIVKEAESLIRDNFLEGGALHGTNEFMKEWFGIDLDLGVRKTVDDIIEPTLEWLSELSGKIDHIFATTEAVKETANFARNAALLGRPQGWSKVENVFDQSQEAKHAHLRQRKFIERETAEQEIKILAKGSKSIIRNLTTR